MPTLVIIGGGPAGLSAAIYAVRAGLDVHVLYKDDGALGKADRIENYFGFPDVIPGPSCSRADRRRPTVLVRGCSAPRSRESSTPTAALRSRRPAASAMRTRCCSRPALRAPSPLLRASARSKDAA